MLWLIFNLSPFYFLYLLARYLLPFFLCILNLKCQCMYFLHLLDLLLIPVFNCFDLCDHVQLEPLHVALNHLWRHVFEFVG